MPLRQVSKIKGRAGNTNVILRRADGRTLGAIATATSGFVPSSPTGLTATPVGTGGTLAAGTYAYRVSAVVNSVESLPAAEKTATTTGTTSSVTLSWTAVAGASSYKVYGRTSGAELLMGTVTGPTVTFTDTGSVTPSGTMPTNPSATITADNYGTGLSPVTSVAKATSLKGASVSYQYRYGNPAGHLFQ